METPTKHGSADPLEMITVLVGVYGIDADRQRENQHDKCSHCDSSRANLACYHAVENSAFGCRPVTSPPAAAASASVPANSRPANR